MSGAKTPAPSLPWSPAPKGPSIVEAARRVQTDTELVIHDDRLREPSAHGTFPPAPGEQLGTHLSDHSSLAAQGGFLLGPRFF